MEFLLVFLLGQGGVGGGGDRGRGRERGLTRGARVPRTGTQAFVAAEEAGTDDGALFVGEFAFVLNGQVGSAVIGADRPRLEIGRASCRERV